MHMIRSAYPSLWTGLAGQARTKILLQSLLGGNAGCEGFDDVRFAFLPPILCARECDDADCSSGFAGCHRQARCRIKSFAACHWWKRYQTSRLLGG